MQDLVRIAYPSFFIRVGRPHFSYLRGQAANQLLIDTADVDPIVALHFHGDAFGWMYLNWVRITYADNDPITRSYDTVPYPHELQRLGIAFSHAGDGVGYQAPGQSTKINLIEPVLLNQISDKYP